MPTLRLNLFGAPQIYIDDRSITIRRSKAVALLAYLAITRRMHRRDHLAGMLHPEYPNRVARTYLRQSIYALTKALGKTWFQITTEAVGLDPDADVVTDVDRFIMLSGASEEQRNEMAKRLSDAVALAQSEFMTGFSIPDAPMFEEWQMLQRENLMSALDNTYETLIVVHEQSQNYLCAIEVAQKWIALNPLNEAAHCALMRQYAHLGRKAAALNHYDEVVRILRSELDAPPSAATVAVVNDIRHNLIETNTKTTRSEKFKELVYRERESPSSNIPTPLSTLIGREREIDEVTACLHEADSRLVTIWGIGGIGKTRLCLAVAEKQVGLDDFRDGVVYVPLSPLSQLNQIIPAIASALDLQIDASDSTSTWSARHRLLDFLRNQYLLLVLDNLEHLPHIAGVISDILESASGVKILATSRERMRLSGEKVYTLQGLSYPTTEDGGDAMAYSAPQLFLARVRQTLPDYQPDALGVEHIVAICQLVDGMPLAIELAAAWMDTLNLAEIRSELASEFRFLSSDGPGVLERHRSMEKVFQASYGRLSEDEKRSFRCLSVFRGGFTRAAAQDVAGVSLRDLTKLASKSLVRFHRGRHRYDLHELMRQFGQVKLAEYDSEEGKVSSAHALYYCGMLERGYRELQGTQQLRMLDELAADEGNLLIAWQYAVQQRRSDLLTLAADGLGRYFEWTGNIAGGVTAFSEMHSALEPVSESTDNLPIVHSLAWLANFERLSGNTERAKVHLEQGLDLLAKAEDTHPQMATVQALLQLVYGLLYLPLNLDKSVTYLDESRRQFEQLEYRWESATAQTWLGEALREIGRIAESQEMLQEAQRVFEEYGDKRSIGTVLESRARSYLLDAAELETALETAEESLSLRRMSGDQIGIVSTLLLLSYVHCWLNQPVHAEPLMQEALELAQRLGHREGECEAYYIAESVYNYLEDAEAKRAAGEKGLALAREIGDVRLISNFLRSLGNQIYIEGDVETANRMHIEACEIQEQAGIEFILPWLRVVRAYSSWKLQNYEDAYEQICDALSATIEHQDHYTVVHALQFLAQVVASTGDLERAVEIMATTRSITRWDKSLTGRYMFVGPLEELTNTLSPELKEAALQRGQQRDIWDMASLMLEEVQSADWQWV